MSTKQMVASHGDSHERWQLQRHISSGLNVVDDECQATAASEHALSSTVEIFSRYSSQPTGCHGHPHRMKILPLMSPLRVTFGLSVIHRQTPHCYRHLRLCCANRKDIKRDATGAFSSSSNIFQMTFSWFRDWSDCKLRK